MSMKKTAQFLGIIALMAVIGFGVAGCKSPTDSGPTVNTVVTPTATPAAGAVISGTTITLASFTAGAEIWYTIDGSVPAKDGVNSTKYTNPIAITAAVTIKAIAVKDGMNDSAILEAVYTIAIVVPDTVATPTATPAAGAVANGSTVTLATTTEGATIYYTTNGDIPTTSSTEYTSPIAITDDLTIKAFAVKEGMTNSDILESAYMISRPIATVLYENSEITQNGTINAGEVPITMSKNITVVIKNTGTEVLSLDTANITITGTDTDAFTKTTNPGGSISVGGQTSFVIKCEPSTQGENNATLSIPTNDISRNPVVVYLKTTGVKGSGILSLKQNNTVIGNNSITPFNFGQTALNSSTSLEFTITNTGNIPLILTGTPAVVSSNAVFTVTTQPANTTTL